MTSRTFGKCEICNKEFKLGQMRQHMKSHSKEKPIQCIGCPARFKNDGSYRRHCLDFHGININKIRQ